jgi:hypothetical protein
MGRAGSVPVEAKVVLPPWLGGNNLAQFLAEAGLHASRIGSTDQWRVRTTERYARQRPNLIMVDEAGNASQVRTLISHLVAISNDTGPNSVDGSEVQRRIDHAAQTQDPVDIIWAWLLSISTCPGSDLPELMAGIIDDLHNALSPEGRVHVIRRHGHELLHRSELAKVLLRIQHDPPLRAGRLAGLHATHAAGQLSFASSQDLTDGIFLLDAYLGPLLAALTPSIWAFSAHRQLGVIIYTLGQPLAGTEGDAAELLHVLPLQGDPTSFAVPTLSPGAGNAAIRWWTTRLNDLFGVLTDLAVFTDRNGDYHPIKHLHSRMTVEQLFRRVNSIQIARRDSNARRVLLFTVLDTLERLTGRPIEDLCLLRNVRKRLDTLRTDIPTEATEILLPVAERAVTALTELQDGFFMGHQPGGTLVHLTHRDDHVERVDAGVAAARYIKVLRNATHGHGAKHDNQVDQTNVLLAHHTGAIPADLALLGYLYLLDLLANPEQLRVKLYNGGRV